jgi:hypothetical protein
MTDSPCLRFGPHPAQFYISEASVVSNATADPNAQSGQDNSAAMRALDGTGATDPRKMTIMELSEHLTEIYLTAKSAWEQKRDKWISDALASSDQHKALEAVTRRIAHEGAVEQARISSLFSDSVIRGYSHTVREMLGHLDIKSTAELLQDAKDSFRESAMSSVFTASRVWPVQMSPVDW